MDNNKVRVRIIPCEVYTRVCGYYRPLHAMHEAKREECEIRNDVMPDEYETKTDKD